MKRGLVINGSPRMKRGNTARLLEPFLEGMASAGCEAEVVYASRMKVHPCVCGQMRCWYGTPGECSIKDDMQELYPKLTAADIFVLATPVYVPLPGAMQNIVNRLMPLVEPRLEWRESRTRARFREDVRIRSIALVSTGGWWEKDNMNIVVQIAKELAENSSVEFGGALLRPHAYKLWENGQATDTAAEIFERVRKAGAELVSDGTMNPANLEVIARPLLREEDLRQEYNSWI